MREVIIDTETTGLDASSDRIVEIGCVEVLNHIPTGKFYHVYINPDRKMSADAERVHGLTDAFLADKPAFEQVAEEFLGFIDGAALVAHNASFDFGFLNAELGRIGRVPLDAARMVDTLTLARRRHPAAPNSLDALCARYGIDTSKRTVHGALLDANLLAEVYVELRGGRQAALGLTYEEARPGFVQSDILVAVMPRPEPRPILVSAGELSAHEQLVSSLGAAPLWRQYFSEPVARAS